MIYKTRLPKPDYLLLATIGALVIFGSVMVFSSSAILAGNRLGDPFYYLKRHLMFLAMGCTLGYVASFVNPEFWRKRWFYIYSFTIVLLGLTLVLGRRIGGARRWFYMGPIGFQTSELAKFVLVISLARYIDRYHSKLSSFLHGIVYPVALYMPIAGLILLEPDFGNPFVMGLIFVSLLLVSPISWSYLLVYPAAAMPAIGLLIFKASYRLTRLFTFIRLWRGAPGSVSVDQGAAYQISQALLALGSGGLFGKGLGDSELKLHYLPQPHTDFIFPIIGEELGFIGSVAVIALFTFLAIRGIRVALMCDKLFEKLLALGITFCFVFQAAIHMAVTTALAPTKGITLPFLSYGGSSLLISCVMAGVLIRLSRIKKI